MTDDEKIDRLLNSGKATSRSITVRVPEALFDELMRKSEQRYGVRRQRGLITEGALYFLAAGLVGWKKT